ncbi:ABC-three component system middle component 5 [Erythrobacter sp. W53]|uniref:ABC-three component system middle component 5 n=1 Tax=Erythrobacter sp. W53 TaxID=3425947 RepID=UPI003D766708
MTQLTYNEAFDPYHAIFRLIRLRKGCGLEGKTHFDMLRIMDFYLLFPFRLQNMAFFAEDRSWRRVSKSYEVEKPYGEQPDDASVFSRMEPFQRAAVASLVRAEVLSAEAWHYNQVEFQVKKLPQNVVSRCISLNQPMQDIISILCELRERYPLLGRNGLKDRTGLLEFRYDAV